MLRLRFIWVFKPIFLFNIFIIFPLYCYLYIGTLFKILFSEFILELLRFLLVLRVILELYYLFARSELYWNSVSSFCSQSYNGTLGPLIEPKVILEVWNYLHDSSYIGTLDFISTPKSYIGTLELSQWTRSYIGTLKLSPWIRVILELWNYLSELGVILELWNYLLEYELYWNSGIISVNSELYWNSGIISVSSELYWNSEIISVNTRVNLKLKNYLYELRVILELWNNKLSYFRNCSHWGTRFQIQQSWTFLKFWTWPPKPTSSYYSQSLHSKGNLEHLQDSRKNAP